VWLTGHGRLAFATHLPKYTSVLATKSVAKMVSGAYPTVPLVQLAHEKSVGCGSGVKGSVTLKATMVSGSLPQSNRISSSMSKKSASA
jgi:hypothetical protein